MRFISVIALTILIVLPSCGEAAIDGSGKCTLKAVGKETGAATLHATLSVPEQYLSAAEISNGGIAVEWENCDYPLNAFMSDETANHIISHAPTESLTDIRHNTRLVDADLSIWKFSDGSNEPRFFVQRVGKMKPIKRPRSPLESNRYAAPTDGS